MRQCQGTDFSFACALCIRAPRDLSSGVTFMLLALLHHVATTEEKR